MKNKYRAKAVRIMVLCEVLIMVILAYRLSGVQTWNSAAFIRDGAMFAAGLIVGPLVLGKV